MWADELNIKGRVAGFPEKLHRIDKNVRWVQAQFTKNLKEKELETLFQFDLKQAEIKLPRNKYWKFLLVVYISVKIVGNHQCPSKPLKFLSDSDYCS